MDWQQLSRQIKRNYDFIDRISIEDSDGLQEKIHPLLGISSAMTLQAIYSRTSTRLALVFPSNLLCAQWISAICTLKIMKDDYETLSADRHFAVGQKLLVGNKYVVEYLGERFEPQLGKNYIYVRCRDLSKYGIPSELKLLYQPIAADRQLSSHKRVCVAVMNARSKLSPLDTILDIGSMGNKALFDKNIILVSKIGETQRFAKEIFVNGISITDLFLIGKLDVNGDTSIIGQHQIQGNPSCIISSDLFGVSNYIGDNPDKTKGIIIDGSTNYVNNLQLLDEILDRKIPVIVISDTFDTEYLEYLTDRDFLIWQWNKQNIIDSGSITEPAKPSLFSSINNSLSNYCTQQIDQIQCDYPELSDAVEEVLGIRSFISRDQEDINIPYSKLIQFINDISRLVRIPDQSWQESSLQRLTLLQQQFRQQQIWLSDKANQGLERIFNILTRIASQPFAGEGHKASQLHGIIKDTEEPELLNIVVSRAEEVEYASSYWKDQFPDKDFKNIQFRTVSELFNLDDASVPTKIIICGWLNSERMYSLLHSYIVPKYTLLAYPFEKKWFASASKSWVRRNNFDIHAKDFSEIFGLSEKDLKSIEYEVIEPPEPVKKDELDILDFELKIKAYRYHGYTSSTGYQDETCKAKLVVFNQNMFAFITESHRLPVVTDIVKGGVSEGEIPHRYVRELRVGDYILFQESDRNILREIADKGLAREGKHGLRTTAGLWREALRETHMHNASGFEGLVRSLSDAGCKRLPSTIRNWLYDDNQIGPGKKRDLRYIAKATDNKLLLDRIEEVETAISTVRGAHIQASSYIRHKLLAKLPELIANRDRTGYGTQQSMQIDIEEYGRVTILQIEEIADDWEETPINSVNCLFSEED
ncbi:DrmE family protein [Chloroflexota bacterium]